MGADSNRVKVRFARETAWGETPNGPAMTEMKLLSESLNHAKATVASEQVRSDRQRAAILEVGQSADGDISYEFVYGDLEQWFETGLRDAIVSTTASDASTTFAASTITFATAGNAVNFTPGQWVKVQATGNGNDNAVVKVVSATSTVVTCTGSTLSASVASAAVTGRTLKNSTTKTSFLVEGDFEDITGVKYFTGARVDSLSMNIESAQIVTGVFSIQGKRGFAASTSIASTTASAGSNTPLTAAVNVGTIFEGGAVLSNAVQGFNFTLENNMRARPQVGQKPSAEHGDGVVDVTGNLNLYLEDITLLDKMINHTDSSLAFKFTDADSNVVVVSFPKLKYSTGTPGTPGLDQDVFLSLDFEAYRDPTTDATVRMDFLPA